LAETKRNIVEWKSKEINETNEIADETKMGITKEAKEEKKRMAALMLSKNYPLEEIILLTGLSEAEIKGL
jgi:hypothetical protein